MLTAKVRPTHNIHGLQRAEQDSSPRYRISIQAGADSSGPINLPSIIQRTLGCRSQRVAHHLALLWCTLAHLPLSNRHPHRLPPILHLHLQHRLHRMGKRP